MYISSGGGSGKGSAHPNQQTTSTTTAPSAQQQNAALPQQIYQSNIPQVMMQPAFHPSYMPRQPASQLYTSTPQIHFPQSQIAQGFTGYPYFFPNALIPAQHRPNIIQGSISHNPNALALSGVGVVPTNLAAQTQCQTTAYHSPQPPVVGGNTTTIKKRKHALPIIHPVTRKNVLDEYQLSKSRGATDSKHKLKTVESDSSSEQPAFTKTAIAQQQQQSNSINANTERKICESRDIVNRDENSNNISNISENKEHVPQAPPKNVKILVKDSATCTTSDYTKVIEPSEVISENITVSKPSQNKLDHSSIKLTTSNAKDGSNVEEKSETAAPSSSSNYEQLHDEKKVILSEAIQTTPHTRIFYSRTEAPSSFQEKTSTATTEGTKVHSATVIESKKINLPKRNKKYQSSETTEKKVSENNRKKTEFEEKPKPEDIRRSENKKEEADYHIKKKEKRIGEQEEPPGTSFAKSAEYTYSVTNGETKALTPPDKCENSVIAPNPEEKILTRKFDNESARANESMWQNIDIRTSKENTKPCAESEKTRTNVGGSISKSSPFAINYKEGQWSPSNDDGKKAYDIQQLLLLSHAPQSRVKPKICSRTNYIFLQSARPSPALLTFNPSKHYKSNQASSSSDPNNSLNLQCNSKSMSKSGMNGKQSCKVNKPGMIHVRLSLRENIKLNETENAWKPMHFKASDDVNPEIREKEELFRKIRGILNKLTPEKFDTLLDEIMSLQIDTPDKINGVMILVFEKAIDEPNFSASYARLCQRLAEKNLQCEVEESKIKAANLVFKTALLDKTEREFHDNVIDLQAKDTKLKPTIEQIKKCTDPKKKQELQAILEEQEYLLRRRSCGTVRFIGELFKMSMLTGNIIKACINKLLDIKSEEKLECLCKLLTTVGKRLETILMAKELKGSNFLDDVIKKMQNIVDKRTEGSRISNRVRFMLQDVIDLRKAKWMATRPDQQFKALEQASSQQQSSGCGGYNLGKKFDKHDSRSSSMKSYDSECSSFHTKSNLQSSKGGQVVDANKLKQIFNAENPIKLGDSSQFMWRRASITTNSTDSTSFNSAQGFDPTTKKQITSLDNKGEQRESILQNGGQTSSMSLSKSNSQSNLLGCKSSTLPKKIKSATLVNSATSLQSKDSMCSSSDISESDTKKVHAALNKMVDTAIEESVEACVDIWIQIPKKLHWVLVYIIFTDFLHLVKTKPTTRKTLSDIIFLLLQKNYLQLDDFKKGYTEFCKIANEIVIDVPEAWKYIFEFIGGLVHKKQFSIKFFLNRCLLDDRMRKQFFKNFIFYFTREIGPKYTQNLWKNSHFEWKDFLSEDDITKFIHENDFLFLEDRDTPPPVPSEPDIEKITQHVRKLLKNHSSSDCVIDYLRGNIGCISTTFVRSLTITLCECATNYEKDSYTLDPEFFQTRCAPLLQRYIDSKEERELECLSAMEEYVIDLAYPPNLLNDLFSELYEVEIIPADSFIKWWHSRKEKTPLILELSRFFSLLSDEGNDEN